MDEMGERITQGAIRFERVLPGPIENVWDFLVKGDKRRLWLGGGDDIPQQVGAEFSIRFNHNSLSNQPAPVPERFKAMADGASTRHRVLELEPPRRLAISWGGGMEGDSRAEFLLAPLGDRVRLTLTHSLLADSALANVAGGWHTHLEILGQRLRGEEPSQFWKRFEPIEASYIATLSEQAS